jgi:hypothetical protein
VKGGRVGYDSGTAQWTSRDRLGEVHDIRDPFTQAKDSAYSLLEFAKNLPSWPRAWGPIGHAVCFPDGRFDARPLPHTPRDIVIDEEDLLSSNGIARAIDASFAVFADDRFKPDERGVDLLADALAHDIEIRQPLSLALAEAEREIVRLSEQQYGIVNTLAGSRRVEVAGPAGSGKTLIALQKALRLTGTGMKVLLTCFNRPLAEYLRSLPAVVNVPDLDIMNYHQLCGRLAYEAGIRIHGDPEAATTYADLPETLASAVDLLGPRYDAIIADEGQDFDEAWWLPLTMLLKEPDLGILYVFYDDNQALYSRPSGLPDGL